MVKCKQLLQSDNVDNLLHMLLLMVVIQHKRILFNDWRYGIIYLRKKILLLIFWSFFKSLNKSMVKKNSWLISTILTFWSNVFFVKIKVKNIHFNNLKWIEKILDLRNFVTSSSTCAFHLCVYVCVFVISKQFNNAEYCHIIFVLKWFVY